MKIKENKNTLPSSNLKVKTPLNYGQPYGKMITTLSLSHFKDYTSLIWSQSSLINFLDFIKQPVKKNVILPIWDLTQYSFVPQ